MVLPRGSWLPRPEIYWPAGFRADLEKFRLALLEGWILVRYAPREILNGTAVLGLGRAFELRQNTQP